MKAPVSEKKRHIINAAADLFQDRGYSATSMRALATKVGLEPSSIYSHINSKEDLLVEICMNCSELFTQGMQSICTSETLADEKIKSLIRLHIQMAYQHPASVTVFNDEWTFLPDDTKIIFLSLRKDYENNFKRILIDGKTQDLFEFEDQDLVFSIIMNMLNWPYSATKKYKKSLVESKLVTAILKILYKKPLIH